MSVELDHLRRDRPGDSAKGALLAIYAGLLIVAQSLTVGLREVWGDGLRMTQLSLGFLALGLIAFSARSLRRQAESWRRPEASAAD